MSEVLAAAAALSFVLFVSTAGYLYRVRLQLANARRELSAAFQRIEELGMRDELTGAYNRRYLMDAIAKERARAERSNTPFSICLFDIDNFKSINDSRGHAAGDGVLKRFAEVTPIELRAMDVVGRFGGGQFLVLLPGTDGAGAHSCAERVRRRFESNAFAELGGRRATVTAGVASQRPNEDPAALVARAEEALRSGKSAGRNRVMAIA